MYIIQGGAVFEGTIKQFKTRFFTCPVNWTEEQFISEVKSWVANNGWTIECFNLN